MGISYIRLWLSPIILVGVSLLMEFVDIKKNIDYQQANSLSCIKLNYD